MSDPVKENRALFCGFCQLHGLNVLNSQYSKQPRKLITYKGKIHIGENEQINGPPFNALKYGQIDYWLVNDEGKRAVLDVQSKKDIGFDSDHFLLECRLAVTTNSRRQDKSLETKRYSKPDLIKWKAYNDKVRSLLEGKRCDLDLDIHRLGFSRPYPDVIADCYSKPMFFVKDNFGSSDVKKQTSGIRQGCPLSPHLFFLVMTSVDFDISKAFLCLLLTTESLGGL